MPRLDGAATEQDFALPLNDGTDNKFWILVVNRCAVRADMAWQRVSRRNAEFNQRAALGAVVHVGELGFIGRILYDRPSVQKGEACHGAKERQSKPDSLAVILPGVDFVLPCGVIPLQCDAISGI